MPTPYRVPFKSVDEVKEDFTRKIDELDIPNEMRQPLFDFLIEENRQAWIRGKEYGWAKAWDWKGRERPVSVDGGDTGNIIQYN